MSRDRGAAWCRRQRSRRRPQPWRLRGLPDRASWRAMAFAGERRGEVRSPHLIDVLGADGPSQLGVRGLDGVRGVEDSPDVVGASEERGDLVPVPAPSHGDRRVPLAPWTLGQGVEGPWRRPRRRQPGRPLPAPRRRPCGPCRRRGPARCGSDGPKPDLGQVWTRAWRKTAVIASGKPSRPSTTAISTSSTPRFSSSFSRGPREAGFAGWHHAKPELGALGLPLLLADRPDAFGSPGPRGRGRTSKWLVGETIHRIVS